MKPYASLVGMLLIAFLAFGAGCAEEDLLGGTGKGKKATPSSEASSDGNPTPSPSGSGLGGGVTND
ncbi:hypothetical protein D3C87_1086810 [compost metagenome]